jgi:acyl-CoA thioester hydrolase
MTQVFELCHAATGELHSIVRLVTVNVHLPTGQPVPIPEAIREFIGKLG